jgi:hypothetical protein
VRIHYSFSIQLECIYLFIFRQGPTVGSRLGMNLAVALAYLHDEMQADSNGRARGGGF